MLNNLEEIYFAEDVSSYFVVFFFKLGFAIEVEEGYQSSMAVYILQ